MNLKSPKVIVFAVLALFLLGLITIAQLTNKQTDATKNPLVADFYPSNMNNSGGPIVIKAKELVADAQGAKIEITPKASGETQVIDEYIIFWPRAEDGFKDGTEYTAIIEGYKTTSGKSIGVITLKFKIDNTITYAPLQTEVQKRYARPEGLFNDPILSKVLHTEPFVFRTTLLSEESAGDSPHVILLETLVVQGRDETIESFNANKEAAKQSALAWIRSQGIDPDKDIQIVYPSDAEAPADDSFTGDGENPVAP